MRLVSIPGGKGCERHVAYILGNTCGWLGALVCLGIELQFMDRGNIATRVSGIGTLVPEMQNVDVTLPQPHGLSATVTQQPQWQDWTVEEPIS